MLYYLFETLTREFSFFNVFRYLTLRGIFGVEVNVLRRVFKREKRRIPHSKESARLPV